MKRHTLVVTLSTIFIFGQLYSQFRSERRLFVSAQGEIFAPNVLGLYRSTDDGATWRKDNLGLSQSHEITAVTQTANGNLFASGFFGQSLVDRGVVRSTDQGTTWSPFLSKLPIALAMITDNGNNLYALNFRRLIYSSDQGMSWKYHATRLALDHVGDINNMVYSPSGYLFTSTNWAGLYRASATKSGGWRRIAKKQLQVLTHVAVHGTTLFASAQTTINGQPQRAIFESDDGGNHWERIIDPGNLIDPGVELLGIHPDGDLFVAWGEKGFRRLTKQNGVWMTAGIYDGDWGFPADIVVSLNGTLIVGTEFNGLYRSTDDGLTWIHANDIAGQSDANMSRDRYENIASGHQSQFALSQNYPNPFNPTTTVSFDLPEDALVTLKVYNTLGQEVATLIQNELMDEGDQEVEFDASRLASGVYYYIITATDIEGKSVLFSNSKKMILVK
ncbi:MAG: T9SS type A sorting domain-containing protein [Ignavibacteriae bacterium]|nr:T9SS type A sorting domain-containing protein [Ignavibacteria bacterium]MBI3364401.1 T9SS type A sorting domain-containing protein [Ignavibacteriota bacterium]